jgi:DNA-binding response OmpR family regulator
MVGKILIFEDDESVGYLEQMMAEAEGYDVFWLQDAKRVKEEARNRQPDLIIMDVMLPEKSGLDALKELRAEEDLRDIPVLFVSVIDIPTRHPQVMRGQKVGFLHKPFEMEDLIAAIRRLAEATPGAEQS